MEPKKLIGHWPACPLCAEPNAEIKTDSNANPYLWCVNPNCHVQIFTQGRGDRAKHMLAKMKPLAAASPVPAAASPKAAPAAEPVKEAKKSSLTFLG